MKAIIMAGGFGTRLRPLTINVPKPMAPICNIPMMEHVVGLLKRHGLTEITSLLYFQPETIRNHFGDGSKFGIKMSYVLPDEDYGTAGAVRYALGEPEEPVLIISGDLITDFNLTSAIQWHSDKQSQATIVLTRMENPLAYGIVITGDDGRIVRFLEKPSWGEAFSDTINTGIYILQPEAIKMIPPKTNFDFSQNLYPLMLQREMGLHGCLVDGYWKDVGNVDEYHRAHIDFFSGRVEMSLRYPAAERDGGELFTGDDVRIADNVKITGRVVVGDEARIDKGAILHNCIIGDRSHVGAGAELKDTIVWSDSVIGRETRISGSIVCRQALVGSYVQMNDGVIISDNVSVGDSATIKANCKIWPSKTVDAGAIVSSSMVWGEKWNRELFTESKITGLALSEITPEMAVRVSAAFGAFVGKGNSVMISRDASDVSRLIKRGLISGMLAAGANVSDLESLPVPALRFGLSRGNYAAGIYIRHNPDDFRQLDLIFFDGSGLDMPTAKLKKVERLYFGEDFERATLDDIGRLDLPQRVLEDYRTVFLNTIDRNIIKAANFKVVIDHSNGSSSVIFPTLFSQLGIWSTEINASLNPRRFSISPEESARSLVQLSTIVSSLNADIGFRLNPAAEKLTVVDEKGRTVDDQLLLLIVINLFLRTHEARKIAVPVAASMGVEELAEEHNVEVVRVGNDHLAMMEIYRRGDVDFVGGTRGGFVFPGFQTGSDAMLSAVKILELMARTNTRIGDLRARFEKFDRQSVSVPCPWSKKGTVMRKLITDSAGKDRQLIDGVRVFEDNGWVLVAPDRVSAAFNILAESTSADATRSLVAHYRDFVEQSQLD